MKTKREKFLELVSKEKNNTSSKNKERIAKRAMLRESREIAFKVLERLDELGWKQKQLATKMDVSPQYVNKLVKGKENFTLETLVKLQQILDIAILANYQEKKEQVSVEFKGEEETAIVQTVFAFSYAFNVPLVIGESVEVKSNYLKAC